MLGIAAVGGVPGCGGSDESREDATLAVYASAPLSGPEARAGRASVAGAREALEQAGEEAGGVAVKAVILDSGPGASPSGSGDAAQQADTVRAAANARQAVEDSTAIAYIGELDSPATRTSLPITNEARLLHVSTLADATYLTAQFEGSDDVPPETQASGLRTFGTLGALDASPRELGAEAMTLVLDAIDAADDPLDRASVVDAFFGLGERDSDLGTYRLDDTGVATKTGG